MNKINIIAMAGLGERFLKQNFSTPKPLISINRKPMFFYAAKSLPKSEKTFFICNKKLVKNSKFNFYVKNYFKNNKIISLKKKTNGQASTCNIATKFLKKEDIITYGSCDYFYKYSKYKKNKLINESDLVVFVHKPNKNNILNFKEYGWVQKDKKNLIKKIRCKNKVSDNPKKDFVIVGTFTFKNKKIFIRSFKEMLKNQDKINNEYYMDVVAKHAKKLDYKVKYILVNNFKSFGTPRDLRK